MVDDSNTQTINKQMGITHAEFFRLLPVAMADGDYTINGSEVTGTLNGNPITFKLGTETVRQIALLGLPTFPLEITLTNFTSEATTTYIKHFDKSYQRGGG